MAPRWPQILIALSLTVFSLALGTMRSRAQPTAGELIRVYFPARNETVAMPLEEYLVGVLAAEMPNSFHDEALKAQGVVARTYAVRRMQRPGGKGGCPLAPQADVCASPTTGQAYVDQATYCERHGWLAAQAYWRRLRAVLAETRGLIITYQGQPIDALYDSDSIAFTASAQDYFGRDVPYLRAVSEPYGATSPRAEATLLLPLTRIAQVFGQSRAALSQGIPVLARTPTGRVASMQVGKTVVSGREFRERLGLNSTDFTGRMQGDALLVTTRGFGHGVGMSQYGANEMAAAGADFRAIIHHYYSGVSLDPVRR